MKLVSAIVLDAVPIHQDIAWAAAQFEGQTNKVGRLIVAPEITQRRLSYVYGLIPEGSRVADVGVGNGEFASALAHGGKMASVVGTDKRRRRDTKVIGWKFRAHSLIDKPKIRAQVVTCMECIEHIPDPGFAQAVRHLKAMARQRLIVTVPFMEKEPLPKAHHQAFDLARLRRLFRGAKITLLLKGNSARWALVDWKRPIQA